jgi:Leucine Rich repeat
MSITLANPASRPWQRFLRFSVRGMIVVVLVIGGWLGWIVRSARIQREAVAAIENAGGGVRYDWQWSNGVYLRGSKPWARRSLVDLVGVDFFGHVTDVGLAPSSTRTDATTAHIGRLTRLSRLRLDQTSLTDAGLAHIKSLTELVYLDLSGTAVTDAGLAHLKGLTKLEFVYFSGTQVTDAGLVNLKGLVRLSVLNLRNTQVTDSGVKGLQQALPGLKVIR